MAENKRIINLHEQKFAELAVFQTNTIVFQANTNAYLKNLETQVEQLALNLKTQSKDYFPGDTKKNPKYYMAITLKSSKKVQVRKEAERKQTGEEQVVQSQNKTSTEKGQERVDITDES